MLNFQRIVAWISSLKVAISLLLLIAVASAIGTAIPQGEPRNKYLDLYQSNPWLGILNGENLLRLELDHIYTSFWFIALLLWLGIALLACTWRRQWPTLKAAIRWVDYKETNQISKLCISKIIQTNDTSKSLNKLADHLERRGWKINHRENRFAGRKGVAGRFGPPLIHFGMIFLMIGSVWGSLKGEKIEQFLTPGKSLNLINNDGGNSLSITLQSFSIDRDPLGRAEQFRSKLLIKEEGKDIKENPISVNHPMRHKGITVYQADWALDTMRIKIGESPQIQLPLSLFPELGEQIWGVVIPTQKDGSQPVLLALSSEEGPVSVFDDNGKLLTTLRPGGKESELKSIKLKVISVSTASGLLLKHDPGVPLVYLSFGIILIGGLFSVIATKQIWAIADSDTSSIYFGGLSNRDLNGLAEEIPNITSIIKTN